VSGFWRTKKGFFGGERKYLDTGELGEIFINDEARGAEKSNWVMHVYGRSILPEMQNLAKRLAEEFAVHVHVRLETEERKWDCGEYPGT
jgi:hypothetical protein